MKHNYFTGNLRNLILTILACSFFAAVHAQEVATFENLDLEEESYWNGSDGTGGFTSGGAFFPNRYSNDWGGFWSGGFAYSNTTDVTTSGSGNMYSAYTGSGYDESEIYVIGTNNSKTLFPNNPTGINPEGFYATNTTYAALSMQEGDQFAKPFGGEDGNDPDWFLLTVTGFRNGEPVEETVEFYLADYRFEDNSEDYIVDEWLWVDLTPLGTVDSIRYNLSSSDVGEYGMNTPAYFALDHFTYSPADETTSTTKSTLRSVQIFPNPATDVLNLTNLNESGNKITVSDLKGQVQFSEYVDGLTTQINLNGFQSGFYIITIETAQGNSVRKFLKQ